MMSQSFSGGPRRFIVAAPSECCAEGGSGGGGGKKAVTVDIGAVLKQVHHMLEQHGISFEDCSCHSGQDACCPDQASAACCTEADTAGKSAARSVKVVCVSPDLKDAVDTLGKATRGNVVMVRVDGDTLVKLDAWVETGAVRSRSEAAALFIQEGLKVRAQELTGFEEALQEVEQAKAKLRRKAREVFGRAKSADDEAGETESDNS